MFCFLGRIFSMFRNSDGLESRIEEIKTGDEWQSDRSDQWTESAIPFDDSPVDVPIEAWIDLHTFAPSETREVLDAYFDAVNALHLPEVRIIHGKGSYVQKRIVISYLQKRRDVVGFCDASPELGGSGATVVTLGGGSEND